MSRRKHNRNNGPKCGKCGRSRFKTVSLHYKALKHIVCRHCNTFKEVIKA